MADEDTGRGDVRGANKRGAARLAAVQALYQMDVGGTGLMETVSEHESYRLGREIDGELYRDADAAWFRDIVSGVVRLQKELDPLLQGSLPNDWPLARLDSTLRAILRAGSFELCERRDVPVAVVVSEYVDIAKAFYEGDEPKIVNAVLDRIARGRRGDASSGKAGGKAGDSRNGDARSANGTRSPGRNS